MLDFNFFYQKTSNLFHFVENLSEWHFSCRKQDNKGWLAQTGPLSEEEQKALQNMRTLLPRYGFDDQGKFLGIPFLTSSEETVWEEVKKWVEPEEYVSLQEIFQVFIPRFEIIWQKEEPKLKAWKNKLEELTKKTSYDILVQDLETLFNVRVADRSVKVCLLANTLEKGGGGNANTGDQTVTLDCSSMNLALAQRLYSTLWHETIHLVFEKQQLNPLLRDFLITRGNFLMQTSLGQIVKSPTILLKEALVEVAESYVSKYHLGLDVEKEQVGKLGPNLEGVKTNPKNFRLWYIYAAQKLLPEVAKYIKQKRSFDKQFLELTFNCYQNYLEILKDHSI